MNYTKESTVAKRSCYGGYCNMCREVGMDIKPYVSFTLEDYDIAKLKVKIARNTPNKNTRSTLVNLYI